MSGQISPTVQEEIAFIRRLLARPDYTGPTAMKPWKLRPARASCLLAANDGRIIAWGTHGAGPDMDLILAVMNRVVGILDHVDDLERRAAAAPPPGGDDGAPAPDFWIA